MFEGQGVIKEWVGNYTELREMQKMRAAQAAAGAKLVGVKSTAVEEKKKASGSNDAGAVKKKMTFAEKNDLKKLEKEVPALEKKKEELLAKLAAGGTDHHKMMQHSIELERAVKELDRMTDRWLELSERA